MVIKIVKGKQGRLHTCTHVQVTEYETEIEIEMCPQRQVISLPQDGDAVYIMNDRGDTVDSYRWPPARREATAAAAKVK